MNKKAMPDRVHYLDAMRGILMTLGVLYHSSFVFSTYTWLVNSQENIILADGIVVFLNVFRMPTFFIISGYFLLFAVLKYGPKSFLKVRFTRIALPLVITALTLNVIQSYLIDPSNWEVLYLNGGWLSHLWFLRNLLVYILLVYFFAKVFKKQFLHYLSLISNKLNNLPLILMILLLPSFSFIFRLFGRVMGDLDSLESIMNFLPYVIFGLLLFQDENLLKKFTSMKVINFLLFIFIFYGLSLLLKNYTGFIFALASVYFKKTVGWFLAALIFKLCMKFASRPSKILNSIADASYTIYLFHHLLVIAYAMAIMHLDINANLQYILLIILVFLSSFSIHKYLIKRFPLLQLMFNGKYKKK